MGWLLFIPSLCYILYIPIYISSFYHVNEPGGVWRGGAEGRGEAKGRGEANKTGRSAYFSVKPISYYYYYSVEMNN